MIEVKPHHIFTFTLLIGLNEVAPSGLGLESIVTNTVGAVVAGGIAMAWRTGSCREHRIHLFICHSFTQEILIEHLQWADTVIRRMFPWESSLHTSQ
jgi:hypothetical protein